MNDKNKEVKIIYSRLQHLISQLPLEKDKPAVENSIIQQFHSIINELSSLTGKDYSKFKVPINERENWTNKVSNEPPLYYWKTTPVRTKIMESIGQIRAEYNTEQDEINLIDLIKKSLKNIWVENKDRILFLAIFLIIAALSYIIFKINLLSFLGFEFGL